MFRRFFRCKKVAISVKTLKNIAYKFRGNVLRKNLQNKTKVSLENIAKHSLRFLLRIANPPDVRRQFCKKHSEKEGTNGIKK